MLGQEQPMGVAEPTLVKPGKGPDLALCFMDPPQSSDRYDFQHGRIQTDFK